MAVRWCSASSAVGGVEVEVKLESLDLGLVAAGGSFSSRKWQSLAQRCRNMTNACCPGIGGGEEVNLFQGLAQEVRPSGLEEPARLREFLSTNAWCPWISRRHSPSLDCEIMVLLMEEAEEQDATPVQCDVVFRQ